MKKLILASLLTISSLSAFDMFSAARTLNNLKSEFSNPNGTQTEGQRSLEKVNINSLLAKKYINDKNCDQILSNNGYFTTCYNYNYKGLVYGYSKLNGEKVNEGNLKERPKFYSDLNIPMQYRTSTNDYTRSGHDRGHTIASDASFDYSLKSQDATYSMSNITPQKPNTNRKSYVGVEKYERLIASKLGSVEVLTIVDYPKNPERMSHNQIAIPSGYGKVYWNEKEKFQRCFYIPNDDVIYELSELEVSCAKLLK